MVRMMVIGDKYGYGLMYDRKCKKCGEKVGCIFRHALLAECGKVVQGT